MEEIKLWKSVQRITTFFVKEMKKIDICIWLKEKYLNEYQETEIEKVSTDLEFF